MYRVVLDTNVLVSAVIGNGRPRRLLRKAVIDGEYTLVTSDEILGELGRVLHRSEFRISEENIRTILSAFISSSDIQRTRSRFRVVEADPDDDIIINAAYDGMADFIVSGDGDLLKVGEFRGIKIVTVAAMLDLL